VQAALGLAQVERLDELFGGRAEVADRYAELLGDVEGVELPLPDDGSTAESLTRALTA
jgi:perosamine synthetase